MGSRDARIGVMRLRRIIRRAKSTFSELVLHGKHCRQLPVHGQEDAGPQVDAAGQAHLHLPHEGGRAQQYRLPPDGGGVAALLIKAEIVHFLIMAALAAEQAVKQPLKAAVRARAIEAA